MQLIKTLIFAASLANAASVSKRTSSSIDGDLEDFKEPTGKFVDGTISCSGGVPTGNGVISLDWLGIDGWASVTNDQGNTQKTCTEGYYCSYACQAGMSKTQWPSAQPSTGESRGGLLCKDGKLYRTNTGTDYLCEWGKQTTSAVSKVNSVISLCRTDYPGSENMDIPTRLTPGSSKPMSVVDEANYYRWQGKQTSAQYYVNNQGVDVEQGCLWGTSSDDVGNWAPVVLGSGYIDGTTWLSISVNPNNKNAPNYNVKIEASGSGSTISQECKYENGQLTNGNNGACTVAVQGSANFVFY